VKCRHCGGKTRVHNSRLLGKTRRRERACVDCGVCEQTVELWLKGGAGRASVLAEGALAVETKLESMLENLEKFKRDNKDLFKELAEMRDQ